MSQRAADLSGVSGRLAAFCIGERSMAKRYKKLECGDYVRECLYSCPEPQDKPIARAEKSKATSKAQERVNQNNAKIKLAMLIGGNFGPDDLFITPTFSPENLPATYAELQERVRKFYDMFRTTRMKQGKETWYIYAPHHTERVRWHVHSLINAVGPEDWETIKSLWPWGDVHIKRIKDTEYSSPDALAGYLISGWKDRPNSARAWCTSTNLKRIVVMTCREHSKTARLEVPEGCEQCERDFWETSYGSYEYISYFRHGASQNSDQKEDDSQPDSRELIDRGKL